ncbi:MHO_1580 family protein, partial [Mycoplasmopsis bovis]|uniref:MHO_1580 family protein n=1 Tax=Mycoplasmopsis bovis TaxID=28903 RepID=UPI003D292885
NVAIIDNREFVTKATGIHYVDWSDDYKAFRFFEGSLKSHKNMVKRGAIEIRRIFNSDKFVLRYWRVSPTSIDGDEDLSFTLSINNKVVEQTSDNRQNVKYTNKELEKN